MEQTSRKKTLTFFLVIFANFLFASEIYFDKLENDSPSKFVQDSQRFLNEASSEDEKLQIIYFTARAWYHLKDNTKTVENLLILEKRLPLFETKNPVESTKLYGKVAYLYTYLKYSFKASAMLKNSDRVSLFLRNKREFHEARAYYYFYTALVNGINTEYDFSLQNYKKANDQFILLQNIDNNKNPQLGYNIAVNLGHNYICANDFKNALKFNYIALERLNDEKRSGIAYLNIGTIYSKQNKRDSALIFYKKSVKPLISESYIPYLNESFDSIKSIYLAKNDLKMAKYYSDAQEQTVKKLEKIDNIAIKRLGENNEIISYDNLLKVLLTFLLLLIIIIIVLRIKKEKRNINSQKIITLESDDFQNKNEDHEKQNHNKVEDLQDIDNSYHEKVLEKLNEFEDTNFFLDPNITLSKVAVQINTNTQALSRVINKNKSMNFSTYITKLRIEYIIKQLDENPKLKSYKIAYLSTLCGFASHSTFTKAFKNVKGISPSEYIEHIEAKL